jgi:hypothetical protein
MPRPASEKPAHQPSQIDAHVEDGEAGVAALVGLVVERADHGRDVRFEEAVADRDGRQGDEQDGDHHRALVAAVDERALGDGAGDGATGGDERDAAVVIALDLEALAMVEDEALLVGGARWAIAEIVDLHFVALAVDQGVGLRRLAAEGQREVADRHQDRAELHRPLGSEILVGDEPADERGEIDQRGVAAIEAGCGMVAEDEMLGQIERQQRAHAIVAEALPHLGGEQPRELVGVAEPFALARGILVADVGLARIVRGGRIDQVSSPQIWIGPPSGAGSLYA